MIALLGRNVPAVILTESVKLHGNLLDWMLPGNTNRKPIRESSRTLRLNIQLVLPRILSIWNLIIEINTSTSRFYLELFDLFCWKQQNNSWTVEILGIQLISDWLDIIGLKWQMIFRMGYICLFWDIESQTLTKKRRLLLLWWTQFHLLECLVYSRSIEKAPVKNSQRFFTIFFVWFQQENQLYDKTIWKQIFSENQDPKSVSIISLFI